MTTKPTKGLSLPTGNPAAELREMMLAEARQPVGGTPPEATDPLPEDITSKTDRQIYSKKEGQQESETVSKKDSQQERQKAIAKAVKMGTTPMKAIGLKVHEGLYDWLDDNQHKLKKQGVLKQDLLRRALQLLVVEMETEGWKGDALD